MGEQHVELFYCDRCHSIVTQEADLYGGKCRKCVSHGDNRVERQEEIGIISASEKNLLEKESLFNLHKKLCDRGFELMKKKNHDYSKADPLGNFFVAEALQACTAENGIIVRMSDKLSRLVSILEKGTQVESESVEDTIVDIINYSVLLAAVIRKKAGG